MTEEIYSLWHYYDPSRPVNILMAGRSFCDGTYRIAREDSSIIQFEYVYEGTGTLEIDGQRLHPGANDVYYVTRHSRHRYFSDAAHPWHKIWVAFDGPLLEQAAAWQIPPDTYLMAGCNIASYMESILEAVKMHAGDYDRIVDEVTLLLMQVMVHIKNCLREKSDALPEKIRKILDSRVEEHFNLNQICTELNYTKNHLIKAFKERYHISPYAYYRNRKIEVAKRYLDNTGLSVTEIADRLCFADSQYFSGCFKERTGMTPSGYRRRKTKIGAD